jgi:Transposase DDE domain
MVAVTYLPLFVTILFRGMPGIWKGRHRLMLGWLVCMQALFPGHTTLEELARWTPAQVTAWRFRRVLKARYWPVHLLLEWWVQEALKTLPPPKDGALHLGGDGSAKPKRGLQNPLAQKGRKSAHHPWFFGMRFALLMVNWDSDRLPAAFRLIRPKSPPQYQPENALCRAMVGRFVPPPWAKRVIVEGDAAYGSHENIKMVQQRDADDAPRRWGFVFAIARTWQTVEDKASKDLVTHWPRLYSQRTRVPRLPGAKGCTTFWVSSTRLWLRHIGDVPVVLRKRGRNLGPKQTKILVTNLDEWTRRQVVGAYQRRWPVEHIKRERKTDLGLGAHQVSREEGRIEQSFGMAVLAYVLLIRPAIRRFALGHRGALRNCSMRFAYASSQIRWSIM